MKKFINIHSSIYLIFALALFIIPDQLWPMYGLEINDKYARFLSQHTSIFLGGIAAFGFLMNKIQEDKIVYLQVLKSLAITNFLGVIITLYACFNGIFVGFGWSDPIFFAILFTICLVQIKKIKEI
ncbi:hypothetical protein [Tepidibacter hydrothermalis]|uniref:Uncharacterized protein n=1 Tax=Tepidibacter hydrothermalis TaxID=3036126 RepID=A0ABY8EBB8_9FIRM|nr:hypothetical protein [Tepidibacter hydrothermalis]WFD08884.1 hypothetical protein P4S50_10830 [Tepidibacter hydrothermalis]